MLKNKTADGVTHLEWVAKPEDAPIYDDSFWVKEQRWGTFVSIGADDKEIITSLTKELCISSTRWYLKAKQDGFEETTTHEGTVGGKL